MDLLIDAKLAHLNPVAGVVWEAIERLGDSETLFRTLRRRYSGVGDRELRSDLDRLIECWRRDRWIDWQEDRLFPFPEEPWFQ